MKSHKSHSVPLALQELYPGGANAAGVPLIGQTGQQAIKNFEQIISQMTPEDRQAFDMARAQACQEAELWQAPAHRTAHQIPADRKRAT
jgi:hypothetical protein